MIQARSYNCSYVTMQCSCIARPLMKASHCVSVSHYPGGAVNIPQALASKLYLQVSVFKYWCLGSSIALLQKTHKLVWGERHALRSATFFKCELRDVNVGLSQRKFLLSALQWARTEWNCFHYKATSKWNQPAYEPSRKHHPVGTHYLL